MCVYMLQPVTGMSLAHARGHTCVLGAPCGEEVRMDTGAHGGEKEKEEEGYGKCDVCMMGVLPEFHVSTCLKSTL